MQKGLTKKSVIIKGYKATNDDMTCNDFKFELGKWYSHDEEHIKARKNV